MMRRPNTGQRLTAGGSETPAHGGGWALPGFAGREVCQ
ncbi:hypothetical protein shim_06570 [Shimia sp. SK013]|nr:hypothetical protein shim_06570 [Shimia sp. SK013]